MSEPEINKKLLSESISSPWTVFPLTLVILTIIDLAFSLFPVGPLWNIISIVALLVSATVALSSFFWRNYLCHEEQYARELQVRMANQYQERIEAGRAELAQLRDRLQKGFSGVNFHKGAKALGDLVHEYEELQLFRGSKKRTASRRLIFPLYEEEQIQSVLPREEETDALSAAHIFALAEETYKQGLSVLADALRLTQAIRSSNVGRLEEKIVELEKEIEALRIDGAPGARLEIKEATIYSHQERLELLGRQRLRVDELLYQSDQCEASLARTRIELAVLHAGNSETRVSAVTETLQRTIDRAREVQAELKRVGF